MQRLSLSNLSMLRTSSAVKAGLNLTIPLASQKVKCDETSVRTFAASASKPRQGARFAPQSILPSAFKEVRVIGNTTRDAQQSNCSAEMADEHRQALTKLIDPCYSSMQGVKGYEQIWGGTVPMFDIWKRGVQPFDALRQQIAYLPNTPTSMLFRSSAINSMMNQPSDVIDAFVKLTVEAGIDVFTNFDANNDWRNHSKVAEAVLKHGGAHSLYVKDPSGVLTPAMAGALARQIKEAFPHLPLVFHSHYQAGYTYMSYLEAVRNGANGIECSAGFADGAGQPYMLTMIRALEDLGFNTGNPNKQAIARINDYCKTIRPLYTSAAQMRGPDLAVEVSGIAGGQRTILDKELTDAGQPELIPKVDKEVVVVRAEGGKVCQVTPAADIYAREAMRRLRGGNPDANFTPGYASILIGEAGSVLEPVNEEKRHVALVAKLQAKIASYAERASSEYSPQILATLNANADAIVKAVTDASGDTLLGDRIEVITKRIDQLKRIEASPEDAALLQRLFDQAAVHIADNGGLAKVHVSTMGVSPATCAPTASPPTATTATASPPSSGGLMSSIFGNNSSSSSITAPSLRVARNVTEKIAELQAELAALNELRASRAEAGKAVPRMAYETLLKASVGKLSAQNEAIVSKVIEFVLEQVPAVQALVKHGSVSALSLPPLLAAAGPVTCPGVDLLSPGMPVARAEAHALEEELILGTNESPQLEEETAVLYACFNKTAINNMFTNFLKNYRERYNAFPPLFKGHTRSGPKPARRPPAPLKTYAHKTVESLLNKTEISETVSVCLALEEIKARIAAQKAMAPVFAAEKLAEPASFNKALASATIARLEARGKALETQFEARIAKMSEAAVSRIIGEHVFLNGPDVTQVPSIIRDIVAARVAATSR